jgi:hypothetical protein
MDHIRQKAAGHVAGTPDTWLLTANRQAIAIELKAPGNLPTARQVAVGQVIQSLGHYWNWCDSVSAYGEMLNYLRVHLVAHWKLKAADYDATLEGAAIKREETKTGKVSKRRSAPPRYLLGKAAVGRARKAGILI